MTQSISKIAHSPVIMPKDLPAPPPFAYSPLPSQNDINTAKYKRQSALNALTQQLDNWAISAANFRYDEDFSDAFAILNAFAKKAGKLWIAGGSLLAQKLGKPINDIDFFFSDRQTRLAVLDYLLYMGYSIEFVSNNATTLVKNGKRPIQLISNHYYNDMLDCLLGFDISASQFGLRLLENGDINVVEPNRQVFDIKAKKFFLVPSSVGDPRNTVRRLLKYSNQYNITPFFTKETYQVLSLAGELGAKDNGPSKSQYCKEDYAFPMNLSSIWTAPYIDLASGEMKDVLGDMTDCYGSVYDFWLSFKLALDNRLKANWSMEHCTSVAMDMNNSCNFLFIPIHQRFGCWPIVSDFINVAPDAAYYFPSHYPTSVIFNNESDWGRLAQGIYDLTTENDLGRAMSVLMQLSAFLDIKLPMMRDIPWDGDKA